MTDDQTHSRTWAVLARLLRVVFAGVILLVLVAAYFGNLLYSLCLFFLPLALVALLVSRLIALIFGKIEYRFALGMGQAHQRPRLLQFVLRALCYLGVAFLLSLAIPRSQLSRDEHFAALVIFVWGPLVPLLVAELFPRRELRKSYNVVCLAVTIFVFWQLTQVMVLPIASDKVLLAPPFRGEWTVLQGGRCTLLNHHYRFDNQRFAVDLVATRGNSRMQGDPQQLDSYFAFNAPLYAPAAGDVILAVDSAPEQPIGGSDTEQPLGNHVVIQMAPERFVVLAHLATGSLQVQQGDPVQTGQPLARCGNTGNTSEPHIHIQVQNRATFDDQEIRTYPIEFTNLHQWRWGRAFPIQRGELRRNDVLVAEAP